MIEDIKNELLTEAASLVAWHRAQEQLAELRPQLPELEAERNRLLPDAEHASEDAKRANDLWAGAAWRSEPVPGKSIQVLHREWQQANARAETAWEPVRNLSSRITSIEQDIAELEKIERPNLDALSILMQELS